MKHSQGELGGIFFLKLERVESCNLSQGVRWVKVDVAHAFITVRDMGGRLAIYFHRNNRIDLWLLRLLVLELELLFLRLSVGSGGQRLEYHNQG